MLKGGKGTYADKNSENGSNYNVIVQNCTYCTVTDNKNAFDRSLISGIVLNGLVINGVTME